MGKSSEQKTTQDSTKAPWAPAQAGLQQILGQAQGYGQDPSMFAPVQGQQTQTGIAQLGALSQQPAFGQQAIQNVSGATTGAIGSGVNTLQSIAGGANVGNNPYIKQALQDADNMTADTVNRQFSGMGRYGSTANQAELARQIGITNNSTLANLTNSQQQQQQQAALGLGQLGIQGGALAPQAAQSAAQQYGYGLGAGQMQDLYQQGVNQSPYTATAASANLINPIAQMGGTQNTQGTSTTTPSLGQQIIGGGMMGLGLLGGPLGAPIMGGLGSLFGGGSTQPGTALNGGWSTTTTPTPWWQQ